LKDVLFFYTIRTADPVTDKMEPSALSYRVMTTGDCIKYLESHGLTIHDDSRLRIKSRAGLVYILPNGESILVPTNFDLKYPGIIFKDKDTYLHLRRSTPFLLGKKI